ncbi:MAG: hypothetical protein V3U65_15000 [Granulosicoccaceae bacterium]
MKIVIALVVLAGLAKWWFTDPSISGLTNDVSFSYIVKYSGNGGSGDSLPMLLALHGNGDTPDHFYETALDQLSVPARIVLLEGPFDNASGSAWPWNADSFAQYGKGVSEAAEQLAAKFPTVQKPVLLGFSGGGMMAYYQAVKHGDSYSYIFPVSGKLSPDLFSDKSFSTGAKVLAFHGKNDGVISSSGGKTAVKILQANGVGVKFVEFDGGHLGIFKEMKPEITKAIEQKLLILN